MSYKNVASFSIPKYILNVILPKCTMVYNEAVSSTYFQIALTINNNDKAKGWQKRKSWVSIDTISRSTGYNLRTVKIAIDTLEEVRLLKKITHGKLKMYELINNNINNVDEMLKFNKYVEEQLLSNVSLSKSKTIKKKFNDINEKLKINIPFYSKFLLKKVWIPDINNLRKMLLNAESIYKGSSLFFINLIVQQQSFKKNEKNLNNIIISERDRSLMIGCSQPTLNRYIIAYENAGVITREKQNNLYQIKLNNKGIEKNEWAVDNKMENYEDKVICPICNSEMKNEGSLNRHLSVKKESRHYALSELRKIKNSPDYETTIKIYNEEKEKIDSLKDISKDKVKEEYDMIEFFNITIEPPQEKAPDLLAYFYSLNGQRSPNWPKECKQIKNLLTRKQDPLTPDQVKVVLRYMARKGHIDIRFLYNSVNEAFLEQQYLQEIEIEGTPAYLVKRFYNGFNMDINPQTFIRDVMKIRETMNSGLSFEETKFVIDYMIKTDCRILNFIDTKRSEALSKMSPSRKTINSFNNNPSFFDQDFLNILRDELMSGRTRLSKVEDKYKDEALKIANDLFMRHKFSTKFTGFEWAWRIGLPLDRKMYELACRELHKQTYLDYVISSGKLKPEQEKKYRVLRIKYEEWLQKQHDFFRSNLTNQI